MVMQCTFTISSNEYPEFFKMYKKNRDKKLEEVFKSGYKIHFPDKKQESENIHYHQILKGIEGLKYDNNIVMEDKLNDLLSSISKLTGIGNNSYKKGEVGEIMLEEIFDKRYGDVLFENKSKTPHSGDAWLYLPDKKIVMLESKNYNYRVNRDEVEKMEHDMKSNNIKFGVFVSWNSIVQNRKDIDIHTFYHDGETYTMIIISNLSNGITKLDLSIQLIRKIAEKYEGVNKFPWLVNDIKDNLNELDIIIKKNTQLKDSFDNISSSIRSLLDSYYATLRDYQYDVNKQIKLTINKIDSTMNKSLELNITEDHILIEEFKDSKLFPLICKLFDTIKKLNWVLVKKENLIELYDKELFIGSVKIQKKKVILSFNKLGLNFELENNNYQESINMIPIIFKNV